ncbi:MAG TPA: tellurite resistance TerB C-terminal domain-containing protein [Longimicrobium sp.]|nr:tellurite resistance TerB C-terminal domain-containing protein [Longimicrobium sp.]
MGVLSAPVDRLRQVAEAATDAIDRYSRWVGRTGEGDSLPALALLPAEVLRPRVRRTTPPLLADVAGALGGEPRATVPSSMLLRHWPGARADKLSKKEAEGLTELLEKLGVGIAPDVRHTGINPANAGHAAVFFLPGDALEPGPDFAAASLLLTLGAAVADADQRSHAEEEEMERHLEAAYRLSDADRARLRAHMAWLRVCPPSLPTMKKQLEPLPAEQRAGIARALIAIAGADGHVSPAEVKMLSKLYPLLGLDAGRVYADVHALAAGPGPVTVIPADEVEEYAIPRPAAAPPKSGFTLDVSRIASIQRETHDVTRVLAGVFADDAPAEAAPVEIEEASTPAGDNHLPGMDAAHSALVHALGERDEISAGEFASLAERSGLMAGGAIETINDAAFQLCDEPLLEGTDPIEINPHAREELLK